MNVIGHSEIRQGNCLIKCMAICKYLWERPEGIHTLEIIACEFDHVFVIVNRENNDINDIQGWGNAWIIDPWFEEGTIFHASEFDDQFPKMIDFCAQQAQGLAQRGFPVEPLDPSNVSKCLNLKVTIQPHRNKYPSYGDPKLWPVESYYKTNTLLPLPLPSEKKLDPQEFLTYYKSLHKRNFSQCVADIESTTNHVKSFSI